MRTALLGGAAFGIALAAVELWTNAARLVSLGLPTPLPLAASGAGMMVALATLVGVATAIAARHGRVAHWVAMTLAWILIQEYAGPPGREGRLLVLGPPIGALALVAAGAWIGRRARLLPAALAVVAITAALVAPGVVARGPTAASRAAVATEPAPPSGPDVMIVVLDGVRADHLGAYGYARPTSPHFDALARASTLFTDAVAPATWSLPSQASLFTGRFPSVHRAHDEHPRLDAAPPTLAERFAAAGWSTRAFTASAWLADAPGTARGFAWTDAAWRSGDDARTYQSMYRLLDRVGLGGVDKGGARVVRDVESWLAARPADDRPAFTVVDVVEAEPPFHELPPDVLARFTTRSRAELRAVAMQLALGGAPSAPDAIEQATTTYDAAVAYTDALLGRLVEVLRRRGTLDRTILVVLSDHGELLGEHGAFGHGRSPYEPVLHVPLLVRAPGRVPANRRVETPVSTAGVFATVLDLAGLPPEPSVQVGSLRPVIDGAPHPGPVLAEQFASPPGRSAPTDDPLLEGTARVRAYRVGRRKLVDAEPGGTFLFDLDDDPGETRDVAMAHRTAVASLRESLDEWRERLGIPDLRAAIGTASAREGGVPERGYAAE